VQSSTSNKTSLQAMVLHEKMSCCALKKAAHYQLLGVSDI
jgi:hypothetical protein